jgi:hypothetical protein
MYPEGLDSHIEDTLFCIVGSDRISWELYNCCNASESMGAKILIGKNGR